MPAARTPAQAVSVPAPFGLGVALAVLAGVLLVQRFPSIPPTAALVAIALAGAASWFRHDRWRFVGALLTGIALAGLHARAALDVRIPHAVVGHEIVFDLRIVGLPAADDDGIQFDAVVVAVEAGAGTAEADGLRGRRLRLGWFVRAPDTAPQLASGACLRVPLRLRRPHGLVNPGGGDFERRAAEQRLAATGYVSDAARAVVLDADRCRGGWRSALDALRGRSSARIGDALSSQRARFVAALGLGDTRGLDDADWDVLRATGLTHLIAISGFHVGLVAGFGALLGRLLWRLWPALGRRWPRPQAAAATALAFALAYTALAGFALPTVRTLLMIAAALAARLARRSQRGVDAFAVALLAILVVDPLSVLAPGFWLSFAGVAWLLWCLPPTATTGRGLVLPFLHAQAVAVLGLLPLTVWFFGQASAVGPLANLVGIPWISLGVVPLCLLGLAADPFSDVASGTLWGMAATLMELLWVGLEKAAAWPGALAWLPEPSFSALALALVGALWCLMPRGVPGRVPAACLLLPLLVPSPDRPAHGEAELWLLDTGQGLALLVRTARRDLLYDAGPATPGGADLGASVVVPALRALSVRTLDDLMISHGDADHAGGAGAVRDALRPARESGPPGWARYPMNDCLAGTHWRHDGVDFTVLHPPRWFPYQGNESSCVLRIDAIGASALLAGDIGRHVEARLARLPPEQVRADVLLVPHHGSETSSSLEFLAAVRPRIGLIAVGRDNRFDLPDAVVLGRYDRYRVAVDSTAASGAIRIRLDRDGARIVERMRSDRPRWWRDPLPPAPGYAGADSEMNR